MERGIDDSLRNWKEEGKPFLGKEICRIPTGPGCLQTKRGRQRESSRGLPHLLQTPMCLWRTQILLGCASPPHPMCPQTTPSWGSVLQSVGTKPH